MDKNDSNLPLYIQIANQMRGYIQNELWQEGDRIPTEMELCDLFHVSRITIRKALAELVSENLLYRKKAKGTFVQKFSPNTEDYSTRVKSFTQELKEQGKAATTLDVKIKVSHADHKIAKYLNIKPGDKIIILKRIRGDSNNILAYFKTHIIYQPFYSMKAIDYYGSFYNYLNTLGITINQENEYIEAISANRELQRLLKVNEVEPILKRVRFTSQKEMNFYEYTECYYIGGKYRYYLDFDNNI